MAIYHLHADIVRRSRGHSSVAAAAYRAGEKMYDERTGEWHDYTRKSDVTHSEIMLPANSPPEFANRATLWNAAEKAEKRKDSQVARIFDIALPIELDYEEHIELSREYVQENFVNHGMCADIAIHDNRNGNPHLHVTLTMRHVTKEGFGNKNTGWNQTQLLEQWRENWAMICNDKFQGKGLETRIDHRTLEAQGIDREPTIHVGPVSKHMEARGLESDRAQINREIIARNEARSHEPTPEETAEYIHELRQVLVIVSCETSVINRKISDIEASINSIRIKAEVMEQRADEIQRMKAQRIELHARAEAYFLREYRIPPAEAPHEIRRLEHDMADKEQAKSRLQASLPALLADKSMFKHEYHKQKLLADIHRDRQKILERLEQLERETQRNRAKGKPSRREILADLERRRIAHTLETLQVHEFEAILSELSPGKAKEILAQKERIKGIEKENELTPSL